MKVAIAGYGVEGRASYAYWRDLGAEVAIADERSTLEDAPTEATLVLGADAFGKLADYDLVVRSPGLNPERLPYGNKVWSATNEFFARHQGPIVGVTGTKGKGTTCSLIASILRAAGKTVHLVGNIGTPALEALPVIKKDDIVVFELSSFQLWDIRKSPHIAVVLGIEPDHLDVHKDFDEYVNAKANIRRFQSIQDICLYHPTNEFSRKIAEVPLLDGNTERDGSEFADRYAIKDDGQVYVQDGNFCVQDRVICSVDNLKLPGAHNKENACAAMSAVMELWIDVSNEAFAKGLQDFAGLPHRLKFVAEKDGVRYYDDSIATTPGSAIAAMRSFDAPKLLILGGSDKGADYHEVVAVAKETGTRVLSIGQTGNVIREICQELGVPVEREEGLMPDVVAHAAAISQPGNVVLLSPASASFDQYNSYSDRGDKFIRAVEALR